MSKAKKPGVKRSVSRRGLLADQGTADVLGRTPTQQSKSARSQGFKGQNVKGNSRANISPTHGISKKGPKQS
jgi:hypothetical protein